MNKTYKHTVVGGTFDHFHRGHKKLLNAAFASSERVTIGVSTEKLYKHKLLASSIEPYSDRLDAVTVYARENFDGKVDCIQIDDIYGTTLTEKEIDAIFVTKDNIRAAEAINKKRLELGFPQLIIKVIAFATGNDGKVISSERIRTGEITRDGFAYRSLFKNTLALPANLRVALREPIGKVFTDTEKLLSKIGEASQVIAVGDIVSLSLIESGQQAAVSIIDYKTRRQEITSEQKTLLKNLTRTASPCSNKAGIITPGAVNVIVDAIHKFLDIKEKSIIHVSGEEDLLTLPAILLAPLNSAIIYGQFDQGAVLVHVTEHKKKEIVELINRFEELN